MNAKIPQFQAIPDVLDTISNGELLILFNQRNNEACFFVASEYSTPKNIEFMAAHGNGLVSCAIPRLWAKRLNISENQDISCELSVEPSERYRAIQAISSTFSKPGDFRKSKGHIIPLITQDGGVLFSKTLSNAAVDLCSLANCQPSGVLAEIIGTDLTELSKKLQIKVVSVDDLVSYRKIMESTIECTSSSHFPNKFGDDFLIQVFKDKYSFKSYKVISRNINQVSTSNERVLTRLHSQCLEGDVFGSRLCDCSDQLETAMKEISMSEQGILIYLNQPAHSPKERDFNSAALILRELGIDRIKLMTNNRQKVEELQLYGIHVDMMNIEPTITDINKSYLINKKHKLGHAIKLDRFNSPNSGAAH